MKVFRLDAPASPEALVALAGAIDAYTGRVTIIAEPHSEPVTPARIIDWVAEAAKVAIADLESGCAYPHIRRGRAAAAWGMYVLLDATFEAIGERLGGCGFGGGRGLVVFAERQRARDARFRDLTNRLVDVLVDGDAA